MNKLIPDNAPDEFFVLVCSDLVIGNSRKIMELVQSAANECVSRGYNIDFINHSVPLICHDGTAHENRLNNLAELKFTKTTIGPAQQ